jgi:hypothetical protein
VPESPTSAAIQFQFPTTAALNNATLQVSATCIDSWVQSDTSEFNLTLLPEPPCQDCNQTVAANESEEINSLTVPLLVGGVGLLVVLAMTALLRRKPKGEDAPLWDVVEEPSSEEQALEPSTIDTPSLQLPSGWTNEQYQIWLEGEMPDGWTLSQWMEFTEQQLNLLDP